MGVKANEVCRETLLTRDVGILLNEVKQLRLENTNLKDEIKRLLTTKADQQG